MSLDNVKHIILVLSGKGGVGKSSITTQLALSLSLAGKSVGILDVDLTGPSIPRLLNLEDEKITQAPGGWLPCSVHNSQVLPPIPTAPEQADGANPQTTNGASTTTAANDDDSVDPPVLETPPIGPLHAISLALLLPSRSSAVVWRGPKKTAMVRQFLTSVLWPPNTDYLLIDTPPGTSDEHISLAESLLQHTSPSPSSTSTPHLAGAVIVTTPQAVAISDVRKEINFCRKVGVEILGVVENMSGYVCECCGERTNLFGKGGGEVMAREFGIGFLGSVPVDAAWGRLVEEGLRPGYRGGEGSGEEMGNGEAGEGQDEAVEEKGRDEGLLVDKYRNCSLCGIFGGITRELIGMVEGAANGAANHVT
ncbi:cytosolic Fe-S cluster assembly factor cfd1 [Lecanora helva]